MCTSSHPQEGRALGRRRGRGLGVQGPEERWVSPHVELKVYFVTDILLNMFHTVMHDHLCYLTKEYYNSAPDVEHAV